MSIQDTFAAKSIILMQFKKYIFITKFMSLTVRLEISPNKVYISQHNISYPRYFSLKKYGGDVVKKTIYLY